MVDIGGFVQCAVASGKVDGGRLAVAPMADSRGIWRKLVKLRLPERS